MKHKSILRIGVILAVICIAMAGTASAKSLYVIADINAPSLGPGIPVEAYNINPSGTLSYQTTQHVANIGGGAVGIGIDTDSEMLFITSEFSNVLQKIDAVTFVSQGTQTCIGANNLAGIVVDQDKGLVYTVDRGTSDLYIYDVATFTPVATVTLTNARAWGIALDETADLLYVASNSKTIRYYDTATWTEQGTISVTPTVIGVAVDATNGYVYSGGMSSSLLSKYDGVTETTITCSGGYPIGFAVDPATNNLYVTTTSGDELMAYDSNLIELQSISFNGDPTGLCIPGKGDTGVNKLNLEKTDGVTTVLQGGQLTYTITFDNLANQDPVTGVTLVDDLPSEVSFVSATGLGAVYDAVTHTVSWTIADLPAGATTQTVTVTVAVAPATPVGTILDNAVT
ncbi:MAG: hypothetical protein MIO93_00085, partial [ANME-2 cluster archaeon]|nr:hypothetical protein [ANME-2 cluster archaeon]